MRALSLAVLLSLTATVAAADPIEGLWQTQPDEGRYAMVQIAPCGPAFCGTITRTFSSAGEVRTDSIGKQIVIGMAPQGNGEYRGRVLRPADNKVYNGKASVSGNQMKLSGCVAGGLICKSQTWRRLQ
ncbi:MAG: DUF2147 domain-containing protein [Paracoccus sp. (in: a-proteobacteria)]|nr:DUF2147 domain-containing protein [Paracoccus sp. (in: a-proteobacteria)]MDO5631289.1 DUF2147 domain-containing protein [Paracoccus sp. (in: a-proteobacteria)]